MRLLKSNATRALLALCSLATSALVIGAGHRWN